VRRKLDLGTEKNHMVFSSLSVHKKEKERQGDLVRGNEGLRNSEKEGMKVK